MTEHYGSSWEKASHGCPFSGARAVTAPSLHVHAERGRSAGRWVSLQCPVHRGPGHGEQLGQIGDGVVAGGVHAPQLGLLFAGNAKGAVFCGRFVSYLMGFEADHLQDTCADRFEQSADSLLAAV